MIDIVGKKLKKSEKAKKRSKKHLQSSADRPRMVIYRSNKYIYLQIIDDNASKVVCAVSSNKKELKAQKLGKNVKSAKEIGKIAAEELKKRNISKIVFDRNGYKYHGKVKALAEACREAGINF